MDELIRKKDAIDALMAERKHLLDKGQKGAEHILTHHGYNVIDELPPVQSDVPVINVVDMISRQAAIDLLKQMRKDGDMVPWEGKADANCPETPDSCNAETVEAIPVDWIRNYISNLKDMGVQLSLRDAQAVSVMVDKWAMEQNGNATCGPDYCDINFGGGTKA